MSWAEFFSMGNYAFYVWGSYIVSFIAIGGEIIFLWKRRKRLQERAGLVFGAKNEAPS